MHLLRVENGNPLRMIDNISVTEHDVKMQSFVWRGTELTFYGVVTSSESRIFPSTLHDVIYIKQREEIVIVLSYSLCT